MAEGNRLVVGSSSADNLLDASPILHHVERNLALGSGEADSVEPITDTKKGRDSGGRVCIVEMYLGPLKSFGDGPFLLWDRDSEVVPRSQTKQLLHSY